jgi:hypothetical protein
VSDRQKRPEDIERERRTDLNRRLREAFVAAGSAAG